MSSTQLELPLASALPASKLVAEPPKVAARPAAVARPRGEALYYAEVVERRDVVAHGEARVLWFLRWNDAWVRVTEHPWAEKATSEEEAERACRHGDTLPPGTSWQQRTVLRLPRGTLLRQLRVEPRFERGDILHWLRRDNPRAKRRVTQRDFVLRGNGQLRLVDEGVGVRARRP